MNYARRYTRSLPATLIVGTVLAATLIITVLGLAFYIAWSLPR